MRSPVVSRLLVTLAPTALAATPAIGAVIRTDLSPGFTIPAVDGTYFYIDMGEDGTPSYRIAGPYDGQPNEDLRIFYDVRPNVEWAIHDPDIVDNDKVTVAALGASGGSSAYQYALRLDAGTTINASLFSQETAQAHVERENDSPWDMDGIAKFVAVRIDNGDTGDWFYGYVELSWNVDDTVTVYSFGVETTLNQPITAGAVGNTAPTAVAISPTSPSLPENTDTSSRVKIADINVTDDGSGTNNLAVTGADAASFEIIGTELFVRAGVSLNHESKASYSATVQVDDTSVGSTPDATTNFTLNITNVNEPPTDIALSNNTIDNAAAPNTVVGNFTAVGDPEGGSHAFSFVSGPGATDNGSFSIFSGQLRAIDPSSLTAGAKTVRIRATDTGSPVQSIEKAFTINVSDTTPPTVVSIERANPAQEVTNAGSVTFRVTFSEVVQGVNTSDFTVSGAGASGGPASPA